MAQIILDSNNNLIQGDFDNATLNNRTKLQTTTTNATTNVYVVPNGSSTSAGVSVANNSSLTNASKIVMATNGTTDTQIISGVNGSGTYLPLSFYTNNALAMQIGTNGQMTVAATANPTFSAYQSSGQTLSSGVVTKIQFQTEEWDTASCFDSSTNYRFTPNIAGYYQINGGIQVNATVTVISVFLYKNGSLYKFLATSNTATLSGAYGSSLVYLNGTTDYVELYASVGIGQALNVNGTAGSWFNGAMVRSA